MIALASSRSLDVAAPIVEGLPTIHPESSDSLHRDDGGATTARQGSFLYFLASNTLSSEALGWPLISGRS